MRGSIDFFLPLTARTNCSYNMLGFQPGLHLNGQVHYAIPLIITGAIFEISYYRPADTARSFGRENWAYYYVVIILQPLLSLSTINQ